MDTFDIRAETFQRLLEYAQREGLSPDDLLNRLLDRATKPPADDTADTQPSVPRGDDLNFIHSRHLRHLLNNQMTYIIRTDMEGRLTYVNRIFQARYGDLYESPDLIGLPSMQSVAPEDHNLVYATVERCIAEPGVPVQVIVRKQTASGAMPASFWEFVAITNADGQPVEIQCVGFDITDQLRMQAALHESEARYRALTEMMSDYAALVRVEPDGQLVYEWMTGAYHRITGYDIAEPGTPLLLEYIHPDDRDQVALDIARTLQNERTTTEYRHRHRDGYYIWLLVIRQPVWDEKEGRVVRFYGVASDISERVEAEKMRREQERLIFSLQREKDYNATIQRVIASLAHDLKTPLAVISTSRDMLSRYHDLYDAAKRQEKLDNIGAQLQYVTQLLNDLTLITGTSLNERRLQLSPINLPALCEITVQDIQRTSGLHHRLSFVSDGQVGIAYVDEVLVSRILLNLLSNAVKYSSSRSAVQLRLWREDDWVVFAVIDEGIGINPDELPHIFEPFYRASAVRLVGGTGLGLGIVKECVERHNGRIDVKSEPGVGSVFTVYLPFYESAPLPDSAEN